MTRRDREAWNPRNRHYRRGYRQAQAQAAGQPPRRGCRALLILPVCLVLAWLGALIFAAVTR